LNQFSLLVYLLLLVKETTTIARPPSFASNTTETFAVVVPFGRRAPASAKTSVNACDTERYTRKIREFFCAVFYEYKKETKNAQISRFFVRSNTNTHATFTNDLISLSLSFFPSVRANGEEKKKESEGRRRNIEKEKVPR